MSKRGDSTLQHSFHPPTYEDAELLDEDNLDSMKLHYLKFMYEQGVGSPSIADITTEVVKQRGKKRAFLAKMVCSTTTQLQIAMDLVAGIDKDWSVAKKTLKKLNE